MPRSKSKKKKVQKRRIKSLIDYAKTEDEKWRVRQFHMLLLLADKTRIQALEATDKSAKTGRVFNGPDPSYLNPLSCP